MKLATAWSIERQWQPAITSVYHDLERRLGTKPTFMVFYCTATYPCHEVIAKLRQMAPGVPLHGGTSCQGVMTHEGFHSDNGYGMGLLGFYDPEGSYGVGAAELGDDARAAAREALTKALDHADMPGVSPTMVWLTTAPGQEEQVLQGIEDLLGPDIPVTGGSSADNEIKGEWRQFANDDVHQNAVVLSVLFPEDELMFAFHSGYEPTQHTGTVTRAKGRTLYEIDGKPAAQVYETWSEGALTDALRSEGNILAGTTLYPLGRIVGYVGEVPYYKLSHPDSMIDGGVTLFADIQEGETIQLMRGTPDSLATRAGRVAQSAMELHAATSQNVQGALVIYCAGCMLAVQGRMQEVVSGLCESLGGRPFLGAFTFGEQGCFVGGESRHGNLMISVLLFPGQQEPG